MRDSSTNVDYRNKEDMILRHMPLVKKVVDRIEFSATDMDRDDLLSIGMIGLMDAVDKFDAGKGVPFESYARVRIKGTIIDELRRAGKVSRNRIRDLNQFYEEKAALEQELMRTPTDEEISQRMGIGARELGKIHETVNILPTVSLENALFSADRQQSLHGCLEDRHALSPESHLLAGETRQMLRQALGSLKDRERAVLNMYYTEELTLKEIAYVLDVSVPRVSQIHSRILMKLREEMERLQREDRDGC